MPKSLSDHFDNLSLLLFDLENKDLKGETSPTKKQLKQLEKASLFVTNTQNTITILKRRWEDELKLNPIDTSPRGDTSFFFFEETPQLRDPSATEQDISHRFNLATGWEGDLSSGFKHFQLLLESINSCNALIHERSKAPAAPAKLVHTIG